jgi:hypothetical protein
MVIYSQHDLPAQAQVATKTLLIVDDDPQVITSVVQTLRNQER